MPRGVYDRSKAKKRAPKKAPEVVNKTKPKVIKKAKTESRLCKDIYAENGFLQIDPGGKYYVLDSRDRQIVYESNDFYKACEYVDINPNYMAFARKSK